MSARAAERVLLIGWDGADWQIIQRLLETGQMPHLEHLIDEGVLGSLAGLRPIVSPMAWTSVATGKRADRHGVHGFVEERPDGTGVRSVSSLSLGALPLWTILSRSGLPSAVVGWYATHPATGGGDLVVSDAYPRVAGPDFDSWPMPPDAVTPERLRATLRELRVHPADLAAEQLRYFVPEAARIDFALDARLSRLARWLAQCATVHAAATYLAERERWALLAVHYETIDRVCHEFMRYRAPRMASVTEEDVALYGDVVDSCYRFHDMMLGRYMRLVGPETTIVVVSAHGFHSDHLRPTHREDAPTHDAAPWRRPSGILVARGPGFKRDELVFGASLLDVAPTVLTVLGVPVGRDMEGRVLAQAFAGPMTPEYVDTHEPNDACDPAAAETVDDRQAAREALEELAALGYVEKPFEVATQAIEAATAQRLFNLSEVHLAKGEPARAAELLEEMLRLRPDHTVARLRMAQCRLDLGDITGCRAVVNGLVKGEPESPWAHLAEGLIRFAEKELDGALDALRRAEQGLPTLALIPMRIGTIQLRRGAWQEAERAFRRALEIDGDDVQAYDGHGSALYAQGRYDEAVEQFTRSVALTWERAAAHLQLGRALAAAGDLDGAVERLRTALELDPTLRPAQEYLATVYRARGDWRPRDVHAEEPLP
jgi:predicted AlkP superfamily phosphohydrolase/phosphomutase/Tfp pilus assembly protein PilF